MSRDTDIARIAAVLHEAGIDSTSDVHHHPIHAEDAAALYDAGLRPSVEPAGVRRLEIAELVEAIKMAEVTERNWWSVSAQWLHVHRDELPKFAEAILAALLPTQASDSPEKTT